MNRTETVINTLKVIKEQAEKGYIHETQNVVPILAEIAVSLAVIADCMVEDQRHKL